MADLPNLTTLFKTYNRRIYNLALSLARNEKDAEDIVEDTFLKLMRNISRFQGRSKLSTWIYRIAYNESLMHLRKKASQYKLSSELNKKHNRPGLKINWTKLADRELLDKELKERLDKAIREIPIKYRLPLVMHIVNEAPVKDVASVLKLTEPSVKTRLHRAYMLIKREIEDYNKDIKIRDRHGDSHCGIWMNFIYNYVAGSLDKDKSLSFKNHIKDCPACNTFLDTYRQALRITRVLECEDIPKELQAKILAFAR